MSSGIILADFTAFMYPQYMYMQECGILNKSRKKSHTFFVVRIGYPSTPLSANKTIAPPSPLSPSTLTSICLAGKDIAFVSQHQGREGAVSQRTTGKSSVGDPDPDPQDLHVSETPGSGSISQIRVRLRILPFSHKGVERTEIMVQNKFLHYILAKT